MEVTLLGFRVAPVGLRYLSVSTTVWARQNIHRREGGEGGRSDGGKDSATILDEEQRGIFRVLDIGRPGSGDTRRADDRRRVTYDRPGPPRHTTMRPGQEWGNVWPAARTFHPAVVPLPVRQGVVQTKSQVVPAKWANAELMKIQNFLHLTPPVIRRHCSALKQFCTAWPAGLETDEAIEQHFPVQVVTSDYLNSSSSIRDRRSRIVVVKFKVDSLQLDHHARDKFIRLIGDRYDADSDVATLTTDRCPYRGQNLDYTRYLLTALYHESWRVEAWEEGQEEQDLQQVELLEQEEEGDGKNKEYLECLQRILNSGEDEAALRDYKEQARRLLNLPPPTVKAQIVN